MSGKHARRLTATRRAMAEAQVDLLILGPGSHMRWLLGFRPHPDERPCLLFVSAGGSGFLMPALNAEDVAAKVDIAMFCWTDGQGPNPALREVLGHVDANTAGRIAIDETLRADHALLAIDALAGAARCYAGAVLGPLRMLKDADEQAALAASARLNDGAMRAAFDAIKPGARERDVAGAVQRYYLDHRARPAFDIIGGGPNGAYPHHATSDRKIASGEAVVIDIGGLYRGFPSDMTRMAVLGTPSPAYREVHAVVEAAVQAALAAARPGVTANAVDAAARGVINAAGYGDYFTTRTGHGLGLDLHEPPWISAGSAIELQTGMVFSIEPGVYMPGHFGVRLEEIVYLNADGPEILSALSREAHCAAG